MSTWNRFLSKMGHGVKRVTGKVEEIGDNAAASIRAKTLAIRVDEQYENLGRIVYRDLHTEEDLEEQKLQIIAEIDAMFDELEAIKANKEAQRAERQKKKNAKKQAEEDIEDVEDFEDCEEIEECCEEDDETVEETVEEATEPAQECDTEEEKSAE